MFPSGETALYIKLTGDILYSYSDRTISINKNTVLDGDGHYILYSGTRYDGDHFITGANNLAITFKNIKYGNVTYPNSNWYGILHVVNTNTNFVVENIDYNIQKGGQPFYANTNVNTLTFKRKKIISKPELLMVATMVSLRKASRVLILLKIVKPRFTMMLIMS